MIVYKAYLKIIRYNKFGILSSIGVFLLISVLFSSSSTSKPNDIKIEQLRVAFINETMDDASFEALKDSFSNQLIYVEIDNNEKAIKDALFYREVRYVAIFNEDFTVKSYNLPGTAEAILVDQLLNRYLNTLHFFKQLNLPTAQANQLTTQVMKQAVEIQIAPKNVETGSEYIIGLRYFNYFVYGLFVVIITGIANVMLSFNEPSITNRTYISSISNRFRSMQLLIGHISYGFGSWLLFIVIGMILCKPIVHTPVFWLFVLNSFIFLFPVVALTFLIGSLIKNKGAVSICSNILSLGFSFISGAFVPLELLDSRIIAIAKFTPSYWFIYGNQKIVETANVSISTILPEMGIQLLFAIVFLIVSIAFTKQRSASKALQLSFK